MRRHNYHDGQPSSQKYVLTVRKGAGNVLTTVTLTNIELER